MLKILGLGVCWQLEDKVFDVIEENPVLYYFSIVNSLLMDTSIRWTPM